MNKVNYVDGETTITAQNLNDIQDVILPTETKTFKGAISAGTIGTRGNQISYTPSYTIGKYEIVYINSSANYIPLVFYDENSNTLYVNWYRATTSAITEAQSEVRVRIWKA